MIKQPDSTPRMPARGQLIDNLAWLIARYCKVRRRMNSQTIDSTPGSVPGAARAAGDGPPPRFAKQEIAGQ